VSKRAFRAWRRLLIDAQNSSPPPRPLEPSRPQNLPAQTTRLIGRAEIIAKLGIDRSNVTFNIVARSP
jgi:hypothetical protein